MKNAIIGLAVFFLAACGGATGGDTCKTTSDCGGNGLVCASNFSGDGSSCAPNTSEPLLCATPCARDADCTKAQYGHKAATSCIANCQGSKYCAWPVSI